MPRPAILVPLAAFAAFALAPAPARADGLYFSESFGGTRFDNELGAYADDAFRLRIALGFRARKTSVEVWVGGDLNEGAGSALPESSPPDPFTYGLDVKRAFALGGPFEAYLRGSASRMSIDTSTLAGYSGRGLGVGTGLQVKAKAPLVALLYPPIALACLVPGVCKKLGPRGTIALVVDQGYDFYRLHHPRRGATIDVEARRWTFGFAIGADF